MDFTTLQRVGRILFGILAAGIICATIECGGRGSRPFFIVGLAYQGKDIVFRFIIEYSSLRDFGP
jgi:hypothetical protein